MVLDQFLQPLAQLTPDQPPSAAPMVVRATAVESTAVESTAVDYDVAIAGAGVVGLTLACALEQSGLRVALIEPQAKDAGLRFHRAYALTLLTGRIFAGLGLWDEILPHITTFRRIRLADETCPAVLDLAPEDLGTAELGYVAEHPVLVKALLNRLQHASHVAWLCPATVMAAESDAEGVTLTLQIAGQEQQIRSRILVAADGSRSPLRQAAGIGTHGWQYWQSCVTAVIRPQHSHGDIAREHFWASGPFATLPLPGNRCQIVLTAPHAEAQHWLEAPEAEFLAELDRRYGGSLGHLELVGDRTLFPVKLMQSDRYTQARLVLVGDAAHSCHPVGGQGLNLGIRDAAALADTLTRAHQRGEDISQSKVLRRYERWRKPENLFILAFTDLLDRGFSSPWLPLVWARRLGLRLMHHIRPLRTLALYVMTGLGGRHPSFSRRRHSP